MKFYYVKFPLSDIMIVLRACHILSLPRQCLTQIHRGRILQKKMLKVFQEQLRDRCTKVRWAEFGGRRPRVGQITASLGLLGLAPVAAAQSQSVKEMKMQATPVREAAPPEDEKSPDAKFDWLQFLRLLLPHYAHLLAAVASALAVALLNIKASYTTGMLVTVAN